MRKVEAKVWLLFSELMAAGNRRYHLTNTDGIIISNGFFSRQFLRHQLPIWFLRTKGRVRFLQFREEQFGIRATELTRRTESESLAIPLFPDPHMMRRLGMWQSVDAHVTRQTWKSWPRSRYQRSVIDLRLNRGGARSGWWSPVGLTQPSWRFIGCSAWRLSPWLHLANHTSDRILVKALDKLCGHRGHLSWSSLRGLAGSIRHRRWHFGFCALRGRSSLKKFLEICSVIVWGP